MRRRELAQRRAHCAPFSRTPRAGSTCCSFSSPIAIILELARADQTAIFVTAALGIVPLAGILGEATDALAHRAGARVGTLLNATFGNAAELIITIAANLVSANPLLFPARYWDRHIHARTG